MHYDTLDITGFKETGDKLAQAIVEAVKDTQMFIIRPYPHVLLMTPAQFDMLKPDPDATPQENLLYKTPLNAMDVRVKGVYEQMNDLDKIMVS